jgi:uncharacterized membrane protein
MRHMWGKLAVVGDGAGGFLIALSSVKTPAQPTMSPMSLRIMHSVLRASSLLLASILIATLFYFRHILKGTHF